MNTAQFSQSFFPTIDGVTITVKNYAQWLNNKYGKTVLVTPYFSEYSDKESFEVIRYKTSKLLGDKLPIERLQQLNLDIIHSHTPFDHNALNFAREHNIPFVSTVYPKHIYQYKQHDKLKFLLNHRIKKLVHYYNQVDSLFATNENIIEFLKKYGYHGHFEMIESGIDLFYNEKNIAENKKYINHLYDIDSDTFVLLYVGKNDRNKNIKLIINSIINLRKMRQKFRMIFIGEGYDTETMKRLVEEHRLKKYVIFVGKIVDRKQLEKYYSRANLFLFPSLQETSTVTLREAANFRCPALVLKDSALTDIIKDNYNGYLSENNNISFSQRIISAINDGNKEEVGKTAQKTLAVNYEQIVEKVHQHYCEIINSSKQY